VRIYEGRLVAGPIALQRVRHEVAEVLEREGATAQTINDTLLVLSELGTNAIHAVGYGDEIIVRLSIEHNGDVLVEVEDAGVGFRLSQQLRLPEADDEHGRGLSIVCLVADETSVKRRRRHTIVTARIRAKRSA
jgi:anti-sigma regulatory factor (Ser/Thr protein kinase)